MAENSLQNQKNEASFVLSEKAKAIIEKFEEKLCKNNFSREDKYSIRIELIWYLFGKKYPEIIGIIEDVLSNCSSEEQAVSSFIKELGDGTTIEKDNNTIAFIVLLGLFLISLNRTNADTRLLDMLEAEQLERLTGELPATLAYYYHVIIIPDPENTKDDFLQLCFGLFSITPQSKFVLDGSRTEWDNPCTGTCSLSAAINAMVGYNMLKNPPLGTFDWVAIEDGQYCLSSKDSSLHDFISNNLTDKGILFYLVSSSTINKDDRSRFRKWVIENKYLHGIIEIHGKQVMIIRRQHADSIFFVNATDDSFLNEGHWNVGKLLEVVNTKDGHYYKEVSFEEFASYNSKFSTFAKRQLAPSVIANEGETVVTIGDLVDLYESETMEDVSCFFLNRPYYFENGYYEPIEAVITPFARRTPNDEFFLFKWDVLSQKFLCSYLAEFNIGIRNLPRRFMYDDFYDSENNPIICTYPDAIVFTLKDKPVVPVHPEYLAKLFSSDMVIRQMDYFREYLSSVDSVCYDSVCYPDLANYFIDNEDFLSIKVIIPSLKEQQRILDLDKQEVEKIKVLWIDNEDNPRNRVNPSEYEIEVTCKKNWKEAEPLLENRENFFQWSAIVIGPSICIDNTTPPTSMYLVKISSSLATVFSNNNSKIPWYVLTRGEDSFLTAIAEFVLREEDWGNFIYSDCKEQLASLFETIQKVAPKKIRNRIIHQYNKVFEVIREHFAPQSEAIMIDILSALHHPEDNKEFKPVLYYNSLRQIVEYLFRATNKIGLLPDYFIEGGKINLQGSSLYLAGETFNPSKDPTIRSIRYGEEGESVFHKDIASIVKSILHVTSKRSHTTVIDKEDKEELSPYYSETQSSYLLFGYALQLCEVIIWFGNYAKSHSDKEANLAKCKVLKKETSEQEQKPIIEEYEGKTFPLEYDEENRVFHCGYCLLLSKSQKQENIGKMVKLSNVVENTDKNYPKYKNFAKKVEVIESE